MPKAPVAVGDTWSADLSAYVDGIAAGTRLDRSKTKSTCTLTSVEKSVALVTCEGSLALVSVLGKENGKPIPWKTGGIQLIKGTILIGLEGRLAPSTLALASTTAGEVERGGKTISLVMKKDHRIDMVVGGEWPASVKLPEPEAPAAPVPSPIPAPDVKPPTAPVPPEVPAMGGMGD